MSRVAWRGIWNFLSVIGLHHQSWFVPDSMNQQPAALSFLISSVVFIVRSVLIWRCKDSHLDITTQEKKRFFSGCNVATVFTTKTKPTNQIRIGDKPSKTIHFIAENGFPYFKMDFYRQKWISKWISNSHGNLFQHKKNYHLPDARKMIGKNKHKNEKTIIIRPYPISCSSGRLSE